MTKAMKTGIKLEPGQQITIDISPAGTPKIEAHGFNGCGCTEATEGIEIVLGGGEAKRKKKPEYYAPNTGGQVGHKLTF